MAVAEVAELGTAWAVEAERCCMPGGPWRERGFVVGVVKNKCEIIVRVGCWRREIFILKYLTKARYS